MAYFLEKPLYTGFKVLILIVLFNRSRNRVQTVFTKRLFAGSKSLEISLKSQVVWKKRYGYRFYLCRLSYVFLGTREKPAGAEDFSCAKKEIREKIYC